MVAEEQVLRSLHRVIQPELKQDLVSLEMIRSVAVEDGKSR